MPEDYHSYANVSTTSTQSQLQLCRETRDIGLAPDLAAGHDLAASLVDPVLTGEVVAGTWDPATRGWRT